VHLRRPEGGRAVAVSRRITDRRKGELAITSFGPLSVAGFAATAVSFGPGRMGFGLFVPEFRSAFSMSTATVGFVSSTGFLGFFFALLISQSLLTRRGPKPAVLVGLGAATTGVAAVALAPNVPILAVGVFLAASSAGFAWTPFNDAVHRKVRDVDRPAALSSISTGTSAGVLLAGLGALGMVLLGYSWRMCWTGFAVVGAVALGANWLALRNVDRSREARPGAGWHDIARRDAIPLFGIAFVYGTTSAVYISFAGDRIMESGGVPGLPANAAPALIFIGYGLFGLAGLMTGAARKAIGLSALLRLLMVAGAISAALLAFAPSSWFGMVLSAGLQGMHVMMTSAVLAFWSERLFPALPSFSFTAALLAMAAGSALGPALAGLATDSFGYEAMFLGLAALPLLTAGALGFGNVRECPVDL